VSAKISAIRVTAEFTVESLTDEIIMPLGHIRNIGFERTDPLQ
jgi:hypothetical protein